MTLLTASPRTSPWLYEGCERLAQWLKIRFGTGLAQVLIRLQADHRPSCPVSSYLFLGFGRDVTRGSSYGQCCLVIPRPPGRVAKGLQNIGRECDRRGPSVGPLRGLRMCGWARPPSRGLVSHEEAPGKLEEVPMRAVPPLSAVGLTRGRPSSTQSYPKRRAIPSLRANEVDRQTCVRVPRAAEDEKVENKAEAETNGD